MGVALAGQEDEPGGIRAHFGADVGQGFEFSGAGGHGHLFCFLHAVKEDIHELNLSASRSGE